MSHREQISGEHGPGTKSWDNHQKKISDQQEELKRKLRKYNQNNCGNKIPLPIGAYDWANRPAVSPEEWVGPTLKNSSNKEFWDNVATGGAMATTAAIIMTMPRRGFGGGGISYIQRPAFQ